MNASPERQALIVTLDGQQRGLLLEYLAAAAPDIFDEAVLAFGWGPEARQ